MTLLIVILRALTEHSMINIPLLYWPTFQITILSFSDVFVFISTNVVALSIDVHSLVIFADILNALNVVLILILIQRNLVLLLSVKVFTYTLSSLLNLISSTFYLLFITPPVFVVIVLRTELISFLFIKIKDNICIS